MLGGGTLGAGWEPGQKTSGQDHERGTGGSQGDQPEPRRVRGQCSKAAGVNTEQ